jgi:hypothetical protein
MQWGSGSADAEAGGIGNDVLDAGRDELQDFLSPLREEEGWGGEEGTGPVNA